MNKEMFFIGELAKQIDINPKTIRYYEEISILPRPKRGTNNYRVYSLDTVNRLSFIRKAQGLGFTLREIKEVLTISDRGNDPCEHVGELLKRRIVDIEKKLMELKSVHIYGRHLLFLLRSTMSNSSLEILNDFRSRSMCPFSGTVFDDRQRLVL